MWPARGSGCYPLLVQRRLIAKITPPTGATIEQLPGHRRYWGNQCPFRGGGERQVRRTQACRGQQVLILARRAYGLHERVAGDKAPDGGCTCRRWSGAWRRGGPDQSELAIFDFRPQTKFGFLHLESRQ